MDNIGYVGAKTSKQGLHKRKDKPNEYEEIDQVDESKVSSEPRQLPANLVGSQTSTKSSKEKMHQYDVAQPTGGNGVPNDQQHIYDRTQHPSTTDKAQQTHGGYHHDNTTGHSRYECLDSSRQESRNKEARSEGHDYDSISITEREKHHGSGTPSSQRTFTMSWRAQQKRTVVQPLQLKTCTPHQMLARKDNLKLLTYKIISTMFWKAQLHPQAQAHTAILKGQQLLVRKKNISMMSQFVQTGTAMSLASSWVENCLMILLIKAHLQQ